MSNISRRKVKPALYCSRPWWKREGKAVDGDKNKRNIFPMTPLAVFHYFWVGGKFIAESRDLFPFCDCEVGGIAIGGRPRVPV